MNECDFRCTRCGTGTEQYGLCWKCEQESAPSQESAPASEQDEQVRTVKIQLCQRCLDGEGEECHTPGCALFLHNSPGHPIIPELYEIVAPSDADTTCPKCGNIITPVRECWACHTKIPTAPTAEQENIATYDQPNKLTWRELWNWFTSEHDLHLLDSELNDIIHMVNRWREDNAAPSPTQENPVGNRKEGDAFMFGVAPPEK